MRLANAEEVDNLAVEIVQNFHFRGFFVKEELRAAREGLDICRVAWENRDDLPGESLLSPYVGERSGHEEVRDAAGLAFPAVFVPTNALGETFIHSSSHKNAVKV